MKTNPWDWVCQLVVKPGGGGDQIVDYWELERLDDATFFLKAAVDLHSSTTFSTVRVDCSSSAPAWNADWLKIILIEGQALNDMNGS